MDGLGSVDGACNVNDTSLREQLVRGGLVLLFVAAACNGSSPEGPKRGDRDAGRVFACLAQAAPRAALGSACSCDPDCDSGFCVDGVCCASACQDTCKACNVPGMMGTCSFTPAGVSPRSPDSCKTSDPGTCGLDGTCDGSGACRQYPTGTVCTPGSCNQAAVTGIKVCDGGGRCVPGSLKICVPYNCSQATKDCAAACTTSADCSNGHACVAGSCGPKPTGAVCTADSQCELGHCSDGICCESSCMGACVACNLVGHEGTCWPIAAGNLDPRKLCKDSGPASCGQTGSCDGQGSCDLYSRGTVCSPPICSGDRLLGAATCDGNGLCGQSDVNDCAPYRCINGACKAPCGQDSDCQTGHVCVNQSCGPRPIGQPCGASTECASNFCVDGVCCENACEGACLSCALASSKGRCRDLPAGALDSRNVCHDSGAHSCGTNGKCDGGGGCQKYAKNTQCAGEGCTNNVYSPPSACDGNGACVFPGTRSCAPFACNGSKCFDRCTQDQNCVTPNVCNGNSCGKKNPGATCNNNTECLSNICAQGVCCSAPCDGVCKSCAQANTRGTCTNLPAGSPDTTNSCINQGAPSCGSNGKCEGGGCQKYAAGTPCKAAACPVGTTNFIPGAACDGVGHCVTPASMSCVPYKCGAAVCNATCVADADCSAGNSCTNGSCGLKPPGAQCAGGGECASGNCVQGVCCNSACNTPCVACNLQGAVGTCKPLANNAPDARCTDSGAANCGTDGQCDGNGACQKYPAGTQCMAASCPKGSATLNPAKQCDGNGACQPTGMARSCGAFLCNATGDACLTNCQGDTDCVKPNLCNPNNNRCGSQAPAGQTCTRTEECQAGLSCVDGVCCTTANCPTCQACNLSGNGQCANVHGSDPDPHGGCPAENPLVCGLTGKCDGAGKCANVMARATCGAGCMPGTCNGTGMCTGQAPINCDDGDPCTADACGADGNCVHTPATDGTACDDGNACTQTDTCHAGKCVGADPVQCSGGAACTQAGTCNPKNGKCVGGAPAPVGTPCDDGRKCTTGDVCDGKGACGGTPVTCPPSADTCHTAGTCSEATGTCSATTAAPDGTPCNDGNACTKTDTCQNGTCTGGNPVQCAGALACVSAGTCDPMTGVCSGAPKPPGTACDDGLKCTTGDVCDGKGTCGGTPVTCPGPVDACHVGGVCDATTGACVAANAKDGTPCNDGNACTQTDICQAGQCVGTRPVSCAMPAQCHVAGTCNPATGMCADTIAPDGTGCDDGNSCTTGDKCVAGACVGGAPKVCPPPDQCHVAGTCNAKTGMCTNAEAPRGTPCNDGNVCTTDDKCVGGTCTGTATTCAAPDKCHLRGTCNPVTGVCTNPNAPDGTKCGGKQTCTLGVCI